MTTPHRTLQEAAHQVLHDGHSLARGAKVKGLGLWVRRSVPAFIMHGATA